MKLIRYLLLTLLFLPAVFLSAANSVTNTAIVAIGQNTVQVSWQDDTRILQWQFYVGGMSGIVGNLTTTVSTYSCSLVSGIRYYTIAGLSPSTTYTLQMAMILGGVAQTASPSTPITFSTLPTGGGSFVLVSPVASGLFGGSGSVGSTVNQGTAGSSAWLFSSASPISTVAYTNSNLGIITCQSYTPTKITISGLVTYSTKNVDFWMTVPTTGAWFDWTYSDTTPTVFQAWPTDGLAHTWTVGPTARIWVEGIGSSPIYVSTTAHQ